MAGKSQILPVDVWAHSSVIERKLEELVHDGLLRSRASQSQLEWRVPPSDHREPAPPERYVVSFVTFHERGLRMPLSWFMRALLHYYKVELHHLAPNSISQATIFAAVCEGYLGMEPHWNLWVHLFKAEHFTKKAGEQGVWRTVHARSCTLQVRVGQGELYIPAQLISSNSGWHDGWFYLRNDDNRMSKFSDRVLMSREDNWTYDVVEEEKPKLQPLLDALTRLQQRRLIAGMVSAAFHRRRVLPLM
jgi:hypothetical protein